MADGLFNTSLLLEKKRVGRIAMLRMDGELYEMTREVLLGLESQLAKGAVVYADDYVWYVGCRRYVEEFLAMRSDVLGPLHRVNESRTCGCHGEMRDSRVGFVCPHAPPCASEKDVPAELSQFDSGV